MDRRYYFIEGDKRTELMEEFKAEREAAEEPFWQLLKDYRADEGLVSDGMSGRTVLGLLYTEEPKIDCKGLRVEKTQVGGRDFFKATPDRRYKKGKELERRLERVNSASASLRFSSWLVKKLSLSCCQFTDRAMHHTTAGYNEEKIVVSIPAPNGDGGDKFPEIPDFMRLGKKSEYVMMFED